MFELKWKTPKEWASVALSDVDALLLDHASCERKAHSIGMNFIVQYPDRKKLLEPMILFAREELEHFHQVFKIINDRGLTLAPDCKDEYAVKLQKKVRTGRDERLLDRLVVSSVIEARGTERMFLIAEHIKDVKLQRFYNHLAKAELRHKNLFITLAHHYFNKETITSRLNEFIDYEADIISQLPFKATLH